MSQSFIIDFVSIHDLGKLTLELFQIRIIVFLLKFDLLQQFLDSLF